MIEEEARKYKDHDDDFYLTSMIRKHENEVQQSNYDAINAKIAFSKYLAVRNLLLYVVLFVLISNNMSFDLSYKYKQHESTGNLITMVLVTVLKILIVLLYLKGLQLYGVYLRKIEKLDDSESIFQQKGYFWVSFTCFVFFIHPFYWLNDIEVSAFTESYFTGDGVYVFYQRDINQYLYIIQFGILFWLACLILLENSYFAATRSQRVCKMFGIENDTIYVVKCVLSQNGEVFVFVSLILCMYYFATLYNYAEIGYALSLKESAFDKIEDYQNAFNDASGLTNYYNTYWNVVITMTTIGYGDMYVRSTLSRFILLGIALVGVVVFPVLIVTVSNLFELLRSEANSMDLYHKVLAKRESQENAARLVTTLMKLRLAKKKKNAARIEELEAIVSIQRKEFSQSYKDYRNQFFVTELGDLSTRIEKTMKKYTIFRTHFLAKVLDEKREDSNRSI